MTTLPYFKPGQVGITIPLFANSPKSVNYCHKSLSLLHLELLQCTLCKLTKKGYNPLLCIAFLLVILLAPTPQLLADYPKTELPQELAVKALMGEARGENYKGKVAVAEAIRNRGTLDGVYGLRAKFQEPEWVWNQARKAWAESESTNLVKGADHWESTDFKKPKWAKNMIVTAKVGKHIFYRRAK